VVAGQTGAEIEVAIGVDRMDVRRVAAAHGEAAIVDDPVHQDATTKIILHGAAVTHCDKQSHARK